MPVAASPPAQDSGSSVRIAPLDGLRGFAVLQVVACHAYTDGLIALGSSPWERFLAGFLFLGWSGVDLFFVLSGFLITRNLLHSVNSDRYYLSFYWKRILRVFPLYYLTLVLCFLVFPALLGLAGRMELADAAVQPSTQIYAWFHVYNWLAGIRGVWGIPVALSHFWSLSVEEQFYSVWPAVVRRWTGGRLVRVCLWVIGVSFVTRFLLRVFVGPFSAFFWTISRADALAIGALAAAMLTDQRLRKRVEMLARQSFYYGLAGFAILLGLTRDSNWTGWAGTIGMGFLDVLYGGLLVLCITLPAASWIPRILSLGALRSVGKYSYCIYLCHHPIFCIFHYLGFGSDRLGVRLHSPVLGYVVAVGVPGAVVLLTSIASWNFLEEPLLRFKDRLPRRALQIRPSQAHASS